MSSASTRTQQTKVVPPVTRVPSNPKSPRKVLSPLLVGCQPRVDQAIKKEPGSEDTEDQAKAATPSGNNLTGDGASANGSGSESTADEAASSTSAKEDKEAAELDAIDNEDLFGSATDQGSESLDEEDLLKGLREEEEESGDKAESQVKKGVKRKRGVKASATGSRSKEPEDESAKASGHGQHLWTEQADASIVGALPWTAVKRRRYQKDGAVKFEMVPRKVFTGGFLLTPLLIDTVMCGDIEMMCVGGREVWLNAAATGKVERRGTFETAVQNSKATLSAAIATAATSAREAKVNAASAGRNLLDIPDDPDSSAGSEAEDDSRRAKVVNPHDGTPQTVKFEGFEFKAAMIGRLLYVEATAAVAEKLVAGCIRAHHEVVKEETKKAMASPLPGPLAVDTAGKILPDGKKEPDQSLVAKSGLPSPVDKCTRYCMKRGTYEVLYQKDEAFPRDYMRSIKGLRVKYSGNNEEKLKDALAKAHEKAKRLWNKLDNSDRPRYQM